MELQFQYNKTAQQELEKLLVARKNALPVLKNKETALRGEVLKSKRELSEIQDKIDALIIEYDSFGKLWNEFDFSLLRVIAVDTESLKIAGVEVENCEFVHFEEQKYEWSINPIWYSKGFRFLKKLVLLKYKKQYGTIKLHKLEKARRMTTQKVNLFEKVQIPTYREAVLKIKRYLEDKENIARAAQKILKKRLNTSSK